MITILTGRSRHYVAFFAVGAFWLLMGMGAIPAHAVEYGGFGGRPAYPRADNPRTDSIFVHTLEPGSVQEEGIKVVNNSAETKTLFVYAADAERSTDGGFACKQKNDPKDAVGTWISLDTEEVTLGPGTHEIIPFTITVPTSASAGEQNGCVLVQEKKTENQGTGVTLSFRTGLRVAITIPGELIRKLELVDFRATEQEDGGIILYASVRNAGNVSIDANVQVMTQSLVGPTLATLGGGYPVLRGETSVWHFDLPKPFWGGWYRSSLVVHYDEHAGASVGVESGEAQTRLVSPADWFFVLPSWQASLIYIAVLLVIAVGVRYYLRQRQVRTWIATSWKPYDIRAGDTITGLADRCGIPWKMLARANRLKPPYALEPGKAIKAPVQVMRPRTDQVSS